LFVIHVVVVIVSNASIDGVYGTIDDDNGWWRMALNNRHSRTPSCRLSFYLEGRTYYEELTSFFSQKAIYISLEYSIPSPLRTLASTKCNIVSTSTLT
jgi:hypothetical protein